MGMMFRGGWWYVRLERGGRTIYSTRIEYEAEARQWLRQAQRSLQENDYFRMAEGGWMVAIIEYPPKGSGEKRQLHRRRYHNQSEAQAYARDVRAHITIPRQPQPMSHAEAVEQNWLFHKAWSTPWVWAK